MKRWEYYVAVDLTHDQLNTWGAGGWELAGVAHYPAMNRVSGKSSQTLFYFKKEIENVPSLSG